MMRRTPVRILAAVLLCAAACLFCLAAGADTISGNKDVKTVLKYIREKNPTELTLESVRMKPTDLLQVKQALPEGAEILVMKNTRDNEADCIEAACRADHVILVHRVYAAACLDPETGDGFSSGTFDRLIDAVHEKGKTVIVVSCQLPYDAADAGLLTWWGSAMPTLPLEGSTWSSNLPEGLLACFGQGSADGRLPVNIPTLDEQYRTTDQILYPRSA